MIATMRLWMWNVVRVLFIEALGKRHAMCFCSLALLAACSTQGRAAQPTAAPAPAATRTGPTAVPTPAAGEYANPVIDRDFPDPDILKVGDTYYAYSTNTGNTNVQAASSKDLVNWQQLSDALPALPAWANKGLTWAPEVTTTADGTSYVLYFVARDRASDKQCIGVATSATPQGPFKSPAAQALICQADQGGSIDTSSFADTDGTRYVLWKNDGNCCGKNTWLYIQRVSADGLTLEGEPAQLVKQDQFWEGNLIEAPTLWKHNNTYFLFYSANNYAGLDYAVGYATAQNPLGPYTKAPGPFLKTRTGEQIVIGPGGQDIVEAPNGDTWIAYHSWNRSVSYRFMNINKLEWQGDTPVVRELTTIPQPAP